MDKDSVLKLMDGLAFFGDMDQSDKEALISMNQTILNYESGDKILAEGDVDFGFYVLMDGKVSVVRTQPTEVVLAQLVPGAIFGEVTLKGQRIRTSSIVADDKVTALKIDGRTAESISSKIMLKLKDQVIGLLIHRLDEVNKKLGTFIR